jgi:uncharacterized membrane protein
MTIITYILSALFLFAGGAKLVGAKPLADQFKEFGLPLSMMRVVGILELAGAVGLQLPALTLWVAVGLGLLMLGAVANHLKVKHPLSKMAPSLVLLVLLAGLVFKG